MPPDASRRPASPRTLALATPDATRALGARLGRLLRAGDLLVLTGDLGAGKTTLTQGIGEGLRVRGPITSPTFVISRVHPSLVGGPALVHVDAYRLGGALELDDLDLDAWLGDGVMVVEWGHGLADILSDDRLEVVLFAAGTEESDPSAATPDVERTAVITTVGPRWATPQARAMLDAVGSGPGCTG